MRLPTLFKQNKNKTYGYTARYYDERKERLQALHEKHHGKKEGEEVSGSFKRRVSFRDDWKAVNQAADTKKSNSRLMVIIVLLTIIAYLVLEKYNIKLF